MNTKKTRWLLWAGCLGVEILLVGDMLYYGVRGSASGLSDDVWNSFMARVAPWRHHLGSMTGPLGKGNIVDMIWFAVLALTYHGESLKGGSE